MPNNQIPEHIKAAQADFEKEKPKKERKPKEKGIRVNLYLSKDENAQLETAAKIAEMKKATAAREMIFLNIKNFESFKKGQKIFFEFLDELSAQGNNLNQMARKLNFNGHPTADVTAAIKKVNNLYNQILILLNGRNKE